MAQLLERVLAFLDVVTPRSIRLVHLHLPQAPARAAQALRGVQLFDDKVVPGAEDA